MPDLVIVVTNIWLCPNGYDTIKVKQTIDSTLYLDIFIRPKPDTGQTFIKSYSCHTVNSLCETISGSLIK